MTQAAPAPAAVIPPAAPKIRPHRLVVYGGGGMGKTTLASMAPRPLILSLEGVGSTAHIPTIKDPLEILSWEKLRSVLRAEAMTGPHQTIVLDTVTKAQALCEEFVCRTVLIDGQPAENLGDYEWGKGQQQLFGQFRLLINDLDALYRRGKSIVLIAHEEVTKSPNPAGEDYLRYEMRLQNSAKCNVRAMMKEWADHVIHISFPIDSDHGKAKDTKNRQIYTEETPTRMAKYRGKLKSMEYRENDNTFWRKVFEGTA